MGCRLSKNESASFNIRSIQTNKFATPADASMSGGANNFTCSSIPAYRYEMEAKTKAEYKSRLERLMCLAKENPEPDFDLSKCNLKEIPSGVFILCRVLRKEILNLSENQLHTINSTNNNTIGLLSDLSLLRILDLRYNRIKQLPEEICKLENLRKLLMSNNQIKKLPKAINSLRNLDLLDVSNNNLQSIDEINCMPNLRILNISGNPQLSILPATLSTCDAICDLIFDQEAIQWPPSHILSSGTANILFFLATGEFIANQDTGANIMKLVQPEDALIACTTKVFHKIPESNHILMYKPDKSGYGNENELLEKIQKKQQQQKEQILKEVLMQQNKAENLMHKIQQQKDNDRDLLIKDILRGSSGKHMKQRFFICFPQHMKQGFFICLPLLLIVAAKEDLKTAAEETEILVIDNFLTGKNHSDALLEKERVEEERLLEKIYLEHSKLRKKEILSTMIDTLRNEENRILDYQQKRDIASADILQQECITSRQLNEFHQNYERSRNEVIGSINENEELQKQAVAALIAKSDARSWSLVEQLRIVEIKLAEMTQFEIERKKYSNFDQINEIAEKRMHLSNMLTDLLEQQEKRHLQLCDTLKTMEEQKSNEQQDYWLLQYQRLLDSRPTELFGKTNSIDPRLSYQFLINGVIHCLPFLQRLLLRCDMFLENITERDLKEAGINEYRDQSLILKSIENFIFEKVNGMTKQISATAPNVEIDQDEKASTSLSKHPIASTKVRELSTEDESAGSDCVICMEEYVRVIFLPCGHMCCCLNCQLRVDICPMCRADIDRKVKVIPP